MGEVGDRTAKGVMYCGNQKWQRKGEYIINCWAVYPCSRTHTESS